MAPLLGLVFASAALLISAVAPGNMIRQAAMQNENIHGMSGFTAILASFPYSLIFALYHIHFAVYVVFVLMVPILYRIAQKCSWNFKYPWAFTVLLYSIYASSFTPTLYATSFLGSGRILNINHFEFIILMVFILFYWCGWVNRKKKLGFTTILKRNVIILCSIWFIALSLNIGISVVVKKDIAEMAAISALRSLATGEASQYHHEYMSRIKLYNDPNYTELVFPEFTVKPRVLFFDDITPDVTDWRNTAVARFYDKITVRLE